MKSFVFAASLLVIVLLINSCGKTTCLDPGIRITFKGFDSTDLDTVLVEQYISNKNFATRVNVSFFDSAHVDNIVQSNDTTFKAVVDTNGIYVAAGYDYKIIVPANNAVYTITNISYHDIKQGAPKNGKGGCTNDTYYFLDTMAAKIPGRVFDQTKVPPVTIVLKK